MRLRLGLPIALALALALPDAGAGGGPAFPKTDGIAIRADDGVKLAATLYEPTDRRPAAGWPAIAMFHGLGGTRRDTEALAEKTFAPAGYAVLAFDARGQGQSGGLFDADGPRMQRDSREVFDWLAARPEIDRARIGAWGISLGGGAVLHALVDGVPFAAAVVNETWSDLYSALVPQDLAKSGIVLGLLSTVPVGRTDPSVLAVKLPGLTSTSLGLLRTFSAARSTLPRLPSVKTPVAWFQGRRDFVFDISQAVAGYRALGGPKRLYVGDFGHLPSSWPGPDDAVVSAETVAWFRRYLDGRRNGVERRDPVEVAPDPFRAGGNATYPALPPTRTAVLAGHGGGRVGGSGKAVLDLGRTTSRLEAFGSATVTVAARLSGGLSRLVAVITSKPPKGTETVVSEGGSAVEGSGRTTIRIRLLGAALLVPAGSRLRLTLATSSTAQSASNLVYLPLGTSQVGSAVVDAATVALPVLARPISR